MKRIEAEDIAVTVTRSAGADGAVLVMIDTKFEPDASDGGPGLRVLVNDDPVYAGKDYEPVEDVILGCPVCGAPDDEMCTTPAGKPRNDHKGRVTREKLR